MYREDFASFPAVYLKLEDFNIVSESPAVLQ